MIAFGDLKLLFATVPDAVWRHSADAERSRTGDPAQRVRLMRRGFRSRETLKAILNTLALTPF